MPKIPTAVQTTDRTERMILRSFREVLAESSLARIELVMEALEKADYPLYARLLEEM